MNEIKLNNISNYELRKFITYKRSLGYSYSGAILYQLKHIDCMILEFQELHQLSDDTVLSKKCVEYIISKKETNQKYTYASLLRQFGLYLVKMGKKAYVIPKKSLPARKRQFNPYIFDNEEIYKQYQLYSLHGQSKDALAKTQLGAWEYDIIGPWYKCNMTDIMASLGLVQLRRYPSILARRKEIIEKYNEGLKDLDLSVLNHYGDDFASSGHLYLVRLNGKTREECNAVITKMAEAGVATNVHYKPLPLLTAYKNLGFDIKDYPNAYALFENEITLPLHTKLTDEDVEYVIETFRKCVSEV